MPNALGRDVAKEKKFILSRMDWPRWPWLPVKRWIESEGIETGLVYADDPDPDETGTVRLWKGEYDGLQKLTVVKTYPNLDAFLEDGWVVD